MAPPWIPDNLAFRVLAGVRPLIEEFPLERAEAEYARLMSGEARFRVVPKIARAALSRPRR